jgi:hypothetical protein
MVKPRRPNRESLRSPYNRTRNLRPVSRGISSCRAQSNRSLREEKNLAFPSPLQTCTASLLFTKLPRELRDCIYAYLWGSEDLESAKAVLLKRALNPYFRILDDDGIGECGPAWLTDPSYLGDVVFTEVIHYLYRSCFLDFSELVTFGHVAYFLGMDTYGRDVTPRLFVRRLNVRWSYDLPRLDGGLEKAVRALENVRCPNLKEVGFVLDGWECSEEEKQMGLLRGMVGMMGEVLRRVIGMRGERGYVVKLGNEEAGRTRARIIWKLEKLRCVVGIMGERGHTVRITEGGFGLDLMNYYSMEADEWVKTMDDEYAKAKRVEGT